MTLGAIFRFELAYQARRPWPWLAFAVLVVFTFLFTRAALVADALYDDLHLNAPFMIAGTTLFTTLLWLLVAAPVAGEAGARDVATRMHPLTYTMPVTRLEYLGGRFLAALLLNVLVLLGVQVGNLLAVHLPGVHPDAVGPFRPAAYLTTYAYLALPNAFVAVAVQFALAALTGRAMASYVGSVLLFFLAWIVGSLLLWSRPEIGTMVDPIGVTIYFREMAPLWTSVEKRTRLVELEGTLLWNRLLWASIAAGVLACTHWRFRFAHRATGSLLPRWIGRRARGPAAATSAPPTAGAVVTRAIAAPAEALQRFDLATGARQTRAVAWRSFRAVAQSWTGLAVLAGLPVLAVLIVIDQMHFEGVALLPTTARVVTELAAPLGAEMTPWIVIPLLIVFFAGELVWRERDAGLGEIADALPASDWVPLLGKFLGLALVLCLLLALQMAAGMAAQLLLGHREIDLALYATALLALGLPEYLLFAALALAIHVAVNQKYVGHLAAVVAFVIIALSPLFGLEHNLSIYADGPAWSYTEMRGFAGSLAPWAWFKLYWFGWAVLLAVGARLLWMRGRETGAAARLRDARRRFAGPTRRTAAVGALLVAGVGGWIFHNTNVRNPYRGSGAIAARQAAYEHRYKRYERAPQPRTTRVRVHMVIHPERRAVDVRGAYHLVNGGPAAIDSIHVATVPGAAPRAMAFDRPARLVLADVERGHRIYHLATPLPPGDSLRLDFTVQAAPRGFGNAGVDPSVTANGTYFTDAQWFPAIGYQRSRELLSARERRKHGLAVHPIIPSLYDATARMQWGGRIAFEAVVGTSMDQVAVAPGRLQRTWTEGGRRWFHYATDGGTIGSELAFFSARYRVHRSRWRNVELQLFHHPGDTLHLARLLRAVRASLDYYQANLGPYPRGWLSIVERPGLGTGMHADAGMITYAEGFADWRPRDDAGSRDHPSAIVAHEMAHQWTVPYAFVEGAPVMSEGIAWYAAMQVMRTHYGEPQLRRLLRFMRQPHPIAPIRRGEPLLRGLDPYMSYRRGPYALFALSEYMGEARVNTALRQLNATHRSGAPPLATTLDLYRELQAVAPDSLRPLLRDLFEVNTFWDLRADRITARRVASGAWEVTMRVRARKVVADSAGMETEVPVREWVPVGVFGSPAGGDELGAPLYLRLHRLRSGEQTITVTVPTEPVLGGVDPHHLLDWEEREDDDNVGAAKPGK